MSVFHVRQSFRVTDEVWQSGPSVDNRTVGSRAVNEPEGCRKALCHWHLRPLRRSDAVLHPSESSGKR